MNSFRFSPIQNKEQMLKAIEYIHNTCHELCRQSIARYLPVAGNMGIFCHFEDELIFLKQLQTELTDANKRVYGKYFLLHTPLVIPARNDIPGATYRYLYIRQPDPDKPQVGDLDFYLEPEKYTELKRSLLSGKVIKGTRVLPNRPDLDLIELYDPKIDALGFIGDKQFE